MNDLEASMQELKAEDVAYVREELAGAIHLRSAPRGQEGTQALTGVVELILLKAMIPVLASITTAVLTEVLKGKALAALKKREAEAAIEELLRRPIAAGEVMREECFLEARRVLAPMGLRDDEILSIYAKARARITKT